MKLSLNGLELIKEFESFRSNAYPDSSGVITIGYGTTRIYDFPVNLGMEINESVALVFLHYDASKCIKAIEKAVKVFLTQNQIDALTSFTYNIGITGFLNSTLLRRINYGPDITENLFTRWNKITVDGKLVTLNGLTKRRKLEYELFVKE